MSPLPRKTVKNVNRPQRNSITPPPPTPNMSLEENDEITDAYIDSLLGVKEDKDKSLYERWAESVGLEGESVDEPQVETAGENENVLEGSDASSDENDFW